ncbi:ASCH domain-containing protein [Pseudoteredinibacter isoporae]|uniref:ASCH domain-containing protein n=1 Tax=Pseudoteredinibacter isoporae TaxID=570281 RepID=UPI0031083114
MINRALIVRQPWIDMILAGYKPWEMRSAPTKVRGRTGLIEQGSGLIVGEVNLTDSLPALTIEQAQHHREKHCLCLLGEKHETELLEKWRYPWILKNPLRYEKPVPYKHPRGAVVWVKLN